jgi:acyl-CoA thioester hydrolase
MARIKIDLPERFSFSTKIPVRIADVNFGGHVGNDSLLSIMQEARTQYFIHYGYSELNIGGIGTIMSDVAIEYKNELFYGEQIIVSVTAGDFTRAGFDLYYKIEKISGDKLTPIVFAKTGIVCFDYIKKKIGSVPEEAKKKFSSL